MYKAFDKKTSGGVTKSEILSNQQLAEELHKSIIRKFEKQKVHASFIDNSWGADLAHMQVISKFNKAVCEFYNRLMKSLLQNNEIEMYSTHNEGNLFSLRTKYTNMWLQYQKMRTLIN